MLFNNLIKYVLDFLSKKDKTTFKHFERINLIFIEILEVKMPDSLILEFKFKEKMIMI